MIEQTEFPFQEQTHSGKQYLYVFIIILLIVIVGKIAIESKKAKVISASRKLKKITDINE